jgi:hypothetical protein
MPAAIDRVGRSLGDNVFRMTPPELRFPVGQVFQIDDEFNGRQRGTFYFRSVLTGRLRGPFLSSRMAQLNLTHDCDDDGA